MVVIIDAISRRVEELIRGYQTCFGESIHRQRIVWTPKEIEFWKSFRGRCFLTVCWNHKPNECAVDILEELGFQVNEGIKDRFSQFAQADTKKRNRWNSSSSRKGHALRRMQRAKTVGGRNVRHPKSQTSSTTSFTCYLMMMS